MAQDGPHFFETPSIDELQPLLPAYRLEKLLGEGGMGAVYRAYQPSLDRRVAIKVLPREFGEDESFRRSFSAAARAMARLNHPNLIKVFDFGDVDGILYMVLELVDGSTLHEAAGTDPVDADVAIKLVTAICRGLAHAHEYGILHRDIKPANVLLDAKFTPKIGDFGLARRKGEQVTSEEVIHGTPGYSAPEVAAGGRVDEQADVYSVGALLYRLLTGREPSESPLPSASEICGCPPPLDSIIAKATQANPARRFKSAEELGDSLDQPTRKGALVPGWKTSPCRAPTPAPSSRAVPTSPPVAVATPSNSGSSRAQADRRSVSALVAVAIFAVVSIGGATLISMRGGSAPNHRDEHEARNEIRALAPKPDSPAGPSRVATSRQPQEPATQGLARLRTKLAGGARDEFPEGTLQHGQSHFLVLEQRMDWWEAAKFAEAHGGHLAVFSDDEDRRWFRAKSQISRPVWVGAGRSAHHRWQWIDGAPWTELAFPESLSVQRHLAYSATAGLFPASPSQGYGVVIQWHDDGSNPGSLAAQLQRIASAADGEGSSLRDLPYPVGTQSWNDSHYYYCAKSLSWESARKFAKSLDASLAVPSSAEEHQWICNTYADVLEEGASIWLGGFRLEPGDRWQWLGREAWHNSGWSAGEPARDLALDRMILRGPQKTSESAGWVAGNGIEGESEGFLLEWSAPKPPVLVKKFAPQEWLKGVHRKIANRVESDLVAFEKDRRELVRDYARDMNRLIRKEEKEPGWGGRDRGPPGAGPGRGRFRGPGERREILAELEDQLKEASRAERLLAALPEGTSQQLRDRHKESEQAKHGLEDLYDLKLGSHLEFYVHGVGKKADELTELGYLDSAHELRRLTDSLAGNHSEFLTLLFPGSPRAEIPWTSRQAEKPTEQPAQP